MSPTVPVTSVTIVTLTDKIGVECELDFLTRTTPAPPPGSWEARRIRELDTALRQYRASQLVPLPLGNEW